MKKRLLAISFSLVIILALCLSLLPQMLADARGKPDWAHPYSTITGSETQVNSHTTVKKVHENRGKDGRLISIDYEAEISVLPTFTDSEEIIDTTWYIEPNGDGTSFYKAGNNLFTAQVSVNGRTSAADENNRLFVWKPIVSIGNKNLNFGTPIILPVDPYNSNYRSNVLQWTASLKAGGFLGIGSHEVVVTRQLRIIEGMLLEYYTLSGNPGGDFKLQRSAKTDDAVSVGLEDAEAFDSSEFPVFLDVENYHNGFEIAASEFKSLTYPVIIDPSLTKLTSSSDGYFYKEEEATWSGAYDASTAEGKSTSATFHTVGHYYSSAAGEYSVYRSALYFDTSAIPSGADITSATVYLYGLNDFSIYDFYIGLYEGMPTYPHNPLQDSDFSKSHYLGAYGSKYTSSWSTSGYNAISASSPDSVVTAGGSTKLVIMNTSTLAPSGLSEVQFYSAEKGSGYAPKLSVSYTIPVTLPTVSTEYTQDETETTLTLRGYLDDDGGESCVVWFEYGTTSSYGSMSDTTEGVVSDTYFNIQITGLSRGTKYYYRAAASNSAGTSYGTGRTAITLPAIPTNFSATAGDEQNSLTWTKGDGADYTLIRHSTTGYPASISDGTQTYYNTGSSTTHSSLTAGTTYYYSAWSLAEPGWSEQYSDSYATTYGTPYCEGDPDVTTNAATGVGVSSATVNGWLDALNQVGGTVSCTLQYYYGAGTWTDNETTPDVLSSAGYFGEDINGLESDTLYHVRAKAVGTHGTGYGDDVTFTTGALCAPSMTSQAATATGLTYTTLNGKVSDDGGATVTAYYKYGLSSDNLSETTGSATGLETDDTFPCPLTDLESGTTYYFQAIGENSAGTGYGAILNVTTSSPSAPTATTNSASEVGANTATLSGTVATDGGVECDVQFEWGTATGNYTEETGWQEGFETGEDFEFNLSGLTVGETYYYKAAVKNATDTGYGSEKSFTTVFVAPTNFSAKSVGAATISLTWTRQGDQTYITYSTSGYPVDRLDGEQAYFGSASSCTHDSLSPGVTYFYRAWSWREGSVWSESYAEDAATTSGVRTSDEEETPSIQPNLDFPDDIYADPDETVLSNIPGYDIINSAADEIGMPRAYFWLMLSIGILVVIGIIIYIPTKSLLLAALAIGAGLLIFAIMGIIPYWALFVYAALVIAATQGLSSRLGV